MQKQRHNILLFLLIFFISCGRKDKHVFTFPEHSEHKKTKKLSLPLIEEFELKHEHNGVILTWKPIEMPSAFQCTCIGYNLYKFNRKSFIPRKPYHKKPLTLSQYHDRRPVKNGTYYMVRGVFLTKNGLICEGPGSTLRSIK